LVPDLPPQLSEANNSQEGATVISSRDGKGTIHQRAESQYESDAIIYAKQVRVKTMGQQVGVAMKRTPVSRPSRPPRAGERNQLARSCTIL
jgi:hypothetical protein